MRVVYTPLKYKENSVDTSPCIITVVEELFPDEFARFKNNLLEDYDFIRKHTKDLYRERDGVNRCLLVLGQGTDDGILVRSEGYDYARYHAYLPDARQILIRDQYPSLASFSRKMQGVVDAFLKQAQEDQFNGEYAFPLDNLPRTAGDFIYDRQLFGEMLADRFELDIVEMDEDEVYLGFAPEHIVMTDTQGYRELSEKDLRVILAKHQLWLAEEGGEQANFSKCLIKDAYLVYANLNDAIFDDALLVNTDLSRINLSGTSFERTRFQHCNLRYLWARDSNFKNAVFRNCEMYMSKYEGCNFAYSQFVNSITSEMQLIACCSDAITMNANGNGQLQMSDCSDSEREWLCNRDVQAMML